MNGSCIQVASGGVIDPINPRIDDISIEDIAHSLSNQCRFAGHTTEFYSVAQHCILVATEVLKYMPDDALWGLLHDASEAYLVDLPSPIKTHTAIGDEYRKVEGNLMRAICENYGLGHEMPDIVRDVDLKLLATEVRDLMVQNDSQEQKDLWEPWLSHVTPLERTIVPIPPERARQAFLHMYNLLRSNLNGNTGR